MTISMRRAAPLFAAATATAILGIGVATASSASAEPSGSGSGSVFGGSAGGVQTPFGGGNFGSNTSGGVQIPGLQHPFGGGERCRRVEHLWRRANPDWRGKHRIGHLGQHWSGASPPSLKPLNAYFAAQATDTSGSRTEPYELMTARGL